MLFHNATAETLRFSLAELDYEVPPGAECDIPGPMSWAVKSRGLLLTEGAASGKAARVEATSHVAEEPRLPPGVEVGDAPLEDEAGSVEVSSSVRSMTKQLEAEGVNLHGRQKRR